VPDSTAGPVDVSSELGHGTLRLPGTVHVGDGARRGLPRLVAALGRRALVLADPFLVGSAPLAELVAGLAEVGVESRVHSDVVPELPVDILDAAARAATEHEADVVVGIGGGSVLDAAKAVALLLSHGGPLSRYYGENLVPGPVVPLVAVPTTAGTGSEVTPVAVVSDPGRALKVGISSPHLVPAVAVVDPELTHGAPASVTAHSGIDALVHAVESYTSRPLESRWGEVPPVFTGRNALSEPLSLRAAGLLGPWLAVAVHEPGHAIARSRVALGSLLAGAAFGTTGTHLCHALQYPLGAMTRTPHGLGTGLLLPYVVDTLRQHEGSARRLADLGAAMEGIGAGEASADRTLARVVELGARIGIPATLAELGVARDALPALAEQALKSARLLAIAPLDPTREVLLDILERAHAGHLSSGRVA